MGREKRRKITGFDVLILSVLFVVLITVGIRFYIAWNQDWAGMLQNMSAASWIAVVAIFSLAVLIRKKFK